MESLKVMWGRKKSGIDMVMVNESREREREREREKCKEAGGPGDMRLAFRCGTPGVGGVRITAERSGQNRATLEMEVGV